MIKFVKVIVVIGVLLGLLGLGVVWYVGAWNLVFPSHQHDTLAPPIPPRMMEPAVLVFSKTNSFRHSEGIEAGGVALKEIARRKQWGMFHTENGAVFNAQDLARFSAVVFLNASGDMLSEDQQLAFQTWLEAGGGWLGVHSAGDDSHAAWEWYGDNLIGADFTAHPMDPQLQVATVIMENHAHSIAQDLPTIWDHRDEWYSWEKSPRGKGFNILATLDESTYSPIQKMFGNEVDLHMGDHPVVWTNCVGTGRSVYMAMGHTAPAYKKAEVVTLLENSLGWILTDGNCQD